MIRHPKKDVLYRLAVTHGIASIEDLPKYLPMPPSATVNGWLNKFLQMPKKFAATRRYVNRFKLGADPEFCFGSGGNRTEAAVLGLMQGPAFGADNNGRLAEIRPCPARSAVKVVASVLTTLRWMALLMPTTVLQEWVSGAFLWDDGIGGHVHFGRKRPGRRIEVEALDHVAQCLLYLGAYPLEQVARRQRGDTRRQIYGQLGDFRLQQHGYEYRTFPSWLDSPALAFLTLVAAKLAVHTPDLYRFNGSNEHQRLRNYLAYFKAVDDDARLALVLLDRGLPRHNGGDFKARWGITSSVVQSIQFKQAVAVIPPCIPPDEEAVGEVFEHLRTGNVIGFRVPKFTWSPINPPNGYRMCIKGTPTILQKGLGEMVWDLCSSEKMPISFASGPKGVEIPIGIGRDLAARIAHNWKTLLKGKVIACETRPGTITIAPEWREGSRAREIKKLLLSGVFPLWRVEDCKAKSLEEWQATVKHRTKKFAGRVVYESITHKVGPLAEL
jgi:Phage phiEco32-like COOH.NH2 ligase-type 2